jgi:thiamine pyrophosphate-dependent acetolactate synthase large subunit-like protein
MRIAETIEAIMQSLDKDTLYISIFGEISEEIYKRGDRDSIFYMRGGMGLASSIGLGVSLGKPGRKVAVIDGDGSLIMNIGTLATIKHYAPQNFIHIVIDNKVHGSIGGYLTFSSSTLNFENVGHGFGLSSVKTVGTIKDLSFHLKSISSIPGPHFIIAQVEFEPSEGKGHAVRLNHIKERFMKSIEPNNINLTDI